MHVLPAHDGWLPVTWRSRRADFVSLMSLYESNFVRLHQLAPQLRELQGVWVSEVVGDCRLALRIDDHAAYTSTFNLTYVFDTGEEPITDPDLQVRVYHDACLAEVLEEPRWRGHSWVTMLEQRLTRELDERWRRNIMLNKWLDYCIERGHRFAPEAPR